MSELTAVIVPPPRNSGGEAIIKTANVTIIKYVTD
jgi:hypothetical protein